MIFFPTGTDRPMRSTPWMNALLIAANVIVFVVILGKWGDVTLSPFRKLMLFPVEPQWYQFFTYQFLHANWEHLIFNMIFLWVFGNNLEDRFGPVGYLAFYLSGGVLAGAGHTALASSAVLGASGAVSAVTGAYLALFPLSHVSIFYWIFLLIGRFEIPSMYLILFSFGRDLFFQIIDVGGVAYVAHLSGNIFGFVVGMGLLAARILPRDLYDFMALVSRWRRRQQLRSVTRGGYSPWLGKAAEPGPVADPPSAEQQEHMALRSRVADALAGQRPEQAVELYEQLLEQDPAAVLPRQTQLDLANYAMSDSRYPIAGRAYELFLATYPRDEYRTQVELILGLIYARYLDDPDRARPLLSGAADKLTDPKQRQTALDALAEMD